MPLFLAHALGGPLLAGPSVPLSFPGLTANQVNADHLVAVASAFEIVYSIAVTGMQLGDGIMLLRIVTDRIITAEEFTGLCRFITRLGLAPQASEYYLDGLMADQPTPPFPSFRRVSSTGGDLEIGFLNRDEASNADHLKNPEVAKLLVGHQGLPEDLQHVCIPFIGKKARKWLPPVLLEASRMGLKVRLIHLERGIVPHEIVKLADWFHLDCVKEALKSWLTEEMERAFQDYLAIHPETEIRTSVGPPERFFRHEQARTTMIMGSLDSGYHLLNRHHGLNYALLLARTGASGYFPAS